MGVSRMVLSRTALALLRQMSMPPNRAIVAATAASTCSSSRISQTSGSARPPAFSICRAAVPIVPGSEGCGSDVLAAIAILAPSRAARSATARPIPREPPLIKMVLPASVLFIAIPFGDMRQRAPGSHCSAAPASEVLFSPVPGWARSPASEHHRTCAFGFAGSGSDPSAKYWP